MSDDTRFEEQKRLARSQVMAQMRETLSLQAGPLTLELAGSPTAVLNEQRQLVYANRAFRELTGAAAVEDLCGQRPGEILACLHAGNGCGESESCLFCGAGQAIAETLRTRQAATRECHITVRAANRGPAQDLLVRTTPFEVGGRPFALLSLSDIGDQKRRQALQRIFFHDILNTASSFRVYLEILARERLEEGSLKLVGRLQAICATLEEEIQGQKLMMAAETGTLKVQRNLIESRALATQLVEQWEGHESASQRKIRMGPFSDSFTFISDDSLVKRILANMVKNALEATSEGSVVQIALRAEQNDRVRFEVHNQSFMDPVVQKQVFRRFFSTKGQDRGLGTWGMRLLAEEYLGGSVSFTSTEAQGTTFVLSLPSRPYDW